MKTVEKIFFEEAISFYKDSADSLDSGSERSIQIKQELSILQRINSELEWQLLSDDEKQSVRKSMLMILNKWSYEEGKQGALFYESSLIELYDRIEKTLALDLPNTALALRLKSIIAVEKYFINEKKEFNMLRHMDYYLWTSLFKEFSQEHKDLYEAIELNNLNSSFVAMYSNWPKRPYKEI